MAESKNVAERDVYSDEFIARLVARHGWPLPPMTGAEEPEGDGGDEGTGGNESAGGTTNEDGATTEGAGGSPSGETTGDEGVDDDFDRDRAIDTIRRQRASEAAARKLAKEQADQLKELQARLREYEDANKSEDEKRSEALKEAQEGRAAAEKEAASAVAEAARLRVVLQKGLTGDRALALAKRLVGDDEEALAADADELLASFKADESKDVKRSPQERLKSGGVRDAEPEEMDPRKLAAEVKPAY